MGGFVLAMLVLAAARAGADGTQPAAPNALLVVDENKPPSVLRVPLAGGAVTVFSPPAGAQTNLLTSPRGIGVGPDGTIVVANFFEGTLVEIDPATGAQFPVAGLLSGPPVIGSLPRDVAVNPRDPAPGFLPTLGVASQGELHQVVRNTFDTTGSLLAPYPSPYDPYVARFVVALDPGNGDPMDYVVATDALPKLLHYDGALDAFEPLPHPVGDFTGLDVPRDFTVQLVAGIRSEPCPSPSNGILFFTSLSDFPYFVAAPCPGPVAYDRFAQLLYYVDAGSNPQDVRVNGQPIATLPSGTSAIDMALARVPEPGRVALHAAALVALGGLLRAHPGRRPCAR